MYCGQSRYFLNKPRIYDIHTQYAILVNTLACNKLNINAWYSTVHCSVLCLHQPYMTSRATAMEQMLRHSRGGTPKHTQRVIDATQKQTAIDQQKHSCETLIYQRHQTILRLLSCAATASTRWQVRELNLPTMYEQTPHRTTHH